MSQIYVKGINYMTEEYVKQLLMLYDVGLKTELLNPYVGVIEYPSRQFLNSDNDYKKAVQFAGSYYVGFMDMLLPSVDNTIGTGLTYTLIEFKLDGIVRQFLQVSGGSVISQGVNFKSFILKEFPNVNKDFPFNRNAAHVLSDIDISGASYQTNNNAQNPFVLVTSGDGAFTPSISFSISVSGYKCLLQ